MSVFIALGANQQAMFGGKPLSPIESFQHALTYFEAMEIKVKSTSHIWQSPAWPDPHTQPAYYNAAVKIETLLQPVDLLNVLKQIEYDFGRRQSERNASRPLDLDILDYNGAVLRSGRLMLPHPRMCERSFVLFPLHEIAPNWRDPIHNRLILEWIARIPYKDVEVLFRGESLSC